MQYRLVPYAATPSSAFRHYDLRLVDYVTSGFTDVPIRARAKICDSIELKTPSPVCLSD